MLRIYISGAITSDLFNAPRKFCEAERFLKRTFGCEVINPMKLPHKEGATWEEYMVVDLEALRTCDTIYMLPCWEGSKGARIEHAEAQRQKMKIIYSHETINYSCSL
jgi:hypothetical protein